MDYLRPVPLATVHLQKPNYRKRARMLILTIVVIFAAGELFMDYHVAQQVNTVERNYTLVKEVLQGSKPISAEYRRELVALQRSYLAQRDDIAHAAGCRVINGPGHIDFFLYTAGL